MTQPNDRTCDIPAQGKIDKKAGEFWVENPFQMLSGKHNLSAFERNRLFINTGGRTRFVDLSHASQADTDFDSRGVTAADFDRDGDLDLLVVNAGGTPIQFYHNRIPQGHQLTMMLRGKDHNRFGIGARVIAEIGDQKIYRDNFPHDGFSSQGPPEVHIGTGAATKIDRLTIRWPSGTNQVLENVAANGRQEFVEP